ncbi:MAG: ThiF family adenylyltransferase [Candidatus Aenigmarchaeota archaeon]|nr:ThiF family adenylyltransferase [Candidatus Aenigmarchaeota archaeon]
MRIVVVGLGGIGCALAWPLAQAVASQEPVMLLVDGDRFEERNRDRQRGVRGFKAETVADLLRRDSNVRIGHANEFVTRATIPSVVRERDTVFLCVDNHATRKLVSDHAGDLRDVLVISGGNEETDGNVQVFLRRDGRNVTLPLANVFHPEIQDPQDRNPGEGGCLAAGPQRLSTNTLVAAWMLAAFDVYRDLTGDPPFDEIFVDLARGSARPVLRSAEVLAS